MVVLVLVAGVAVLLLVLLCAGRAGHLEDVQRGLLEEQRRDEARGTRVPDAAPCRAVTAGGGRTAARPRRATCPGASPYGAHRQPGALGGTHDTGGLPPPDDTQAVPPPA